MKNSPYSRLIGKYGGHGGGPMLVCIGGMHGNEPAGVEALEHVYNLLSVEHVANPDFRFNGTFLALRGNLLALSKGCRFVEEDLNRSLIKENVDRILSRPKTELRNEELELYELISTINDEIERCDPERVVVLDLHTTTATGGIFVLTSSDEESIRIGTAMNAPVITGFSENLPGTTMSYFRPENFDLPVTTVVFEGGQHTERLSVNRIIAAVMNCLGTLGCIDLDRVENRYNYLLREYSQGLPKVARLVFRYNVEDTDSFEMLPDFQNFMPVEAGSVLAYEQGKPIASPCNGRIIMPKYQRQGVDGFFIIEPLEGY